MGAPDKDIYPPYQPQNGLRFSTASGNVVGPCKLRVPTSTIQLIQYFHQDMQATIQLDGTLLDPITANNGLRQGCRMAPMLFDLHSRLVVEHWVGRVAGTAGVGVTVKYKHN